MSRAEHCRLFGSDGGVIKKFIHAGTNAVSHGGQIEKVTFTISGSTGRASVGFKGDNMSEGMFFPNLFDAELIRTAHTPVYVYISLKSAYTEFYRLSLLGATLRIKRALCPLTGASASRLNMTLASAARSAALKTKGLMHLRTVAMNAGIGAYFFDTIIFPTIALWKAPDILVQERSCRVERTMQKLQRFIYPTSMVRGRLVALRKPSDEAIRDKVVELFSRWCKDLSKLDIPFQLLHFL